jgi:hypothetical protein
LYDQKLENVKTAEKRGVMVVASRDSRVIVLMAEEKFSSGAK